MALFGDALESLGKGGAGTGVAIGVGALLLVPGLLPAVARAVRPLAVGAIKVGLTAYDQVASTAREVGGDLVAEARAELAHESSPGEHEGERTARRAKPA